MIDDGSGPSNDNEILGNLIGTTRAGLAALGNGQSGIVIDGASGTQIGFRGRARAMSSRQPRSRNRADRRAPPGRSSRTTRSAWPRMARPLVGNGGDGILLDDAPRAQIGGTDQYEGNVIGGNRQRHQHVGRPTGLLVEGNYIGTDVTAHAQPRQSRQRRESGFVVEHDRRHNRGSRQHDRLQRHAASRLGRPARGERQSTTRSSPTRFTRTPAWGSTWATDRRPTMLPALPGRTTIRTTRP